MLIFPTTYYMFRLSELLVAAYSLKEPSFYGACSGHCKGNLVVKYEGETAAVCEELPMQRKKQTAEVLLSGKDATLPQLGC